MLAELVRFYRSAPRTAYDGPINESLGAFVARQGYSDAFVADHLFVGAAIWSCTSGMMLIFLCVPICGFRKSQAAQFC